MSNSDGFIEEVTEELRRDQMMAKLKRYGWIGVLVVLAIVGGAAFTEYRNGQERAQAEALGDAVLAALDNEDPAQSAAAIDALDAPDPTAGAVLSLLAASQQLSAEDRASAVENLNAVALNGDVPEVYRQIASFKALTLQADTLDAAARKQGFEALEGAGGSLRLLAREQLALIAIQEEDPTAAIEIYQSILSDAEVTPDLQQRALQVIVALGGEPDLTSAPTNINNG
ncbi:tetratricopeptide repeat protein [Sulfitobacter sp.]|uniref:tetratricopeptide repeat protein n=1 Tax=Sulfitobacter sp. TaxID=1903071 RepID=UPI0032981705